MIIRPARPGGCALEGTSVSLPLVSIVVPSKNQGRFIDDMLDSILFGTDVPLEVLIIDGGSTDDTAARVALRHDIRLQFIPHLDAHPGPLSAIGYGISRATGQWIGIQTTSDGYAPGALSWFASYTHANPSLAWVAGGTKEWLPRTCSLTPDDAIAFDLGMITGTWMDRHIAQTVGVDPRWWLCHLPFSLHVVLEALKQGRSCQTVSRVLCFYRSHEANSFKRDKVETHRQTFEARKELASRYSTLLTSRQQEWLHSPVF